MTAGLRWPAVIVASGVALAGLIVAGTDGPVRVLVTLWFLLVCTGMAYVPLLSITSPATELLLGVALSLSIDTVAATALLTVGGLSATAGLCVLGVTCLAGCALQVRAWAQVSPTGAAGATRQDGA